MPTVLVILHGVKLTIPSLPPEGVGFTDPLSGTLKWIKQNLKIKSFLGTSKNAVMTQIWIALCIYLLLAFLKFQSTLQKSTQQILRLLQLNLF